MTSTSVTSTQDAWILADLMVPSDVLRSRPLPSPEVARTLAGELAHEWLDGNLQIHQIVQWTIERLGLSDVGDFSFDDFEAAYARRVLQFKHLLWVLDQQNMMDDDGDLVDAMAQIERTMAAARATCSNAFLVFNRVEATRALRIPPDLTNDDTLFQRDESSLTSFQQLLLHLLERIEVKGLLKCGDSCFDRVYTKSGHQALAYKFARTIKDEVFTVQKEVDYQMWKLFTNPPHNPKLVTEHLEQSKQSEFPVYDVGDGHYYSFENGVYDIRFDLFFTYNTQHAWPAQAAEVHAKRLEEAKRRLDEAEAAVNGEDDDDVPDELARKRHLWKVTVRDMGDAYPHPTGETVCVNHFQIDFRFDILNEEAFRYDAEGYQADDLDRLFEYQRFERDTVLFCKVFLGRLFFAPNKLERWCKALVMLGRGGTGKSTAAKWVQHVVPSHFHSLMNSNFEERFGMSALLEEQKRLCICEELTEDLSVKQEEFQLFAEGGTINTAEKGVTARPREVKQHLLMCGNQYPRKWKNNGKQITRRCMLFRFDHHVRDKDTGLLDRMCDNTDVLLRQCATLYVKYAATFADVDIQSPGILPAQLEVFLRTMEHGMDPLTSFIGSDSFELAPEYYMPMRDFKEEMSRFLRDNGHRPATWTTDYYSATFSDNGLEVVSGQHGRYVCHGQRVTGDVVFGIRPAGQEDAEIDTDVSVVEDLATWVLRNYEVVEERDKNGFTVNFIPLKEILRQFEQSPFYMTCSRFEKDSYTQERLRKEVTQNEQLKPLFRGKEEEKRLAEKSGKPNKAQGLVHLKLRARADGGHQSFKRQRVDEQRHS